MAKTTTVEKTTAQEQGKETTMQQLTLEGFETAPEQKPFVEGEYFKGMCEIAAACKLQSPLFIPMDTNGIFTSLYFKRLFARKLNDNGSWNVAQFQMKNRYLYNYNSKLKTYDSLKEDNMTAFIETVNNIVKTKTFTVFSIEPLPNLESLDEIVGN